MWIRALAMCKSEEFGNTLPLPSTEYMALGLDHDLEHLPQVNCAASSQLCIFVLLEIKPEHTPSHLQWISNALLHPTWANRTTMDDKFLLAYVSKHGTTTTIPLNATLNRFLVWCIFLGSPVEEEVPKIQDKSYDVPSFCPSHC